jgi:hypothetical protein
MLSRSSERQLPSTSWDVLGDLDMWSELQDTAQLGGDKSPFEMVHGRAPTRGLDAFIYLDA